MKKTERFKDLQQFHVSASSSQDSPDFDFDKFTKEYIERNPLIDDVFQEEEECGKSNCNRPKLDGNVYCQYHYDINFG